MIKIQNNIATREQLPSFLHGLQQESLLDLSWTDPALGVSDCAWFPETDTSAPLGQYEQYGEETLTIDADNKRVIVNRAVVPMTAEQLEQIKDNEARLVRVERNRLIAECDWTQLADAPVDSLSWAIYRQALRDLPLQVGFPFDVTYPTKP